MTERGSKTLIGAFVLGALALAVLLLILTGSGRFAGQTSTAFVLYFDASLRGLSQGAPVYFKGVRVGKVNSIQVTAEGPAMTFSAPVIIEIDNGALSGQFNENSGESFDLMSNERAAQALIRRGLRARLGILSFVTGQLAVDLDLYPDAAPVDPLSLHRFKGLQQIPSMPSSLDAMLDVARRIPVDDIARQALDMLRQVNVQLSGADLPALTDSLVQTSDAIRAEIQAFAPVRDEALIAVRHIRSLSANLDDLLRRSGGDLALALAGADDALAEISALSQSARGAAHNMDGLLAEDSAFMLEFSQTLRSLREASAAISQLATLLELKPDALIFGRSGQ